LEIQQIELLNRGLENQTRNLEILSEEVEKIIVKAQAKGYHLIVFFNPILVSCSFT